jgi:hypothetical protein
MDQEDYTQKQRESAQPHSSPGCGSLPDRGEVMPGKEGQEGVHLEPRNHFIPTDRLYALELVIPSHLPWLLI